MILMSMPHTMPDIPQTYVIITDRTGCPEAIRCLHCKMTSHHPKDVAYRYCGHCHVFHEDIPIDLRESFITEPLSRWRAKCWLRDLEIHGAEKPTRMKA